MCSNWWVQDVAPVARRVEERLVHLLERAAEAHLLA